MLGTISRYYSVPREIYELRRGQYRKKEELERLQEKKLKKLIAHAYNNVSIYNAKFKSIGIKPDDIRGLRDLSKIPSITKEEIRDAPLENILNKDVDLSKCRIDITSGSTGIPLKVYRSVKDGIYPSSRHFYVLFECGAKIRDKVTSIHVPRETEKSSLHKIGFLKRESISIKQPIQDIIDKLIESKPEILSSFPSMLLLLSLNMKDKMFYPKLSFSGGEILTDVARKKINSVFKTELFDFYGTIEHGRLAFECKQHEGLHIISDHHIIEFLKDGKHVSAGERGEIVVTCFHNFTMPFIRYRLRDFGVLSEESCSCGRTYPLIKYIEGRQDDFLTLPSGKVVSPRNINLNFLDSITGIAEFQIIQERRDKFLVKLVKGRDFSKAVIKEIEKIIKLGCLGEEVNVEIRFMDAIQREKTGKLMKIVSKV